MKSKLMLELRTADNILKSGSWNNYRLLLDKMLRSSDYDWAKSMHGLLRAKKYSEMVIMADSVVEQKYTTAAEHFAANQLAALIRKYPFPISICQFGAREEAIRKFKQSEHKCKRINARFRALNRRDPYNYDLARARSWIRYVLGPLPALDDIYGLCGWGPGASVGIHGNATNSARKLLSQSWSVSPGAFHLSRSAMIRDQHIIELLLKPDGARFFSLDPQAFYQAFEKRCRLVNYNNIAFVPKTVRVERTIAVEPLLNGFLQKGVDLYMRKRLKRVGLNLQDQELNQERAREGSLPDALDPYVTIDLSSASDSIAIEFVRYMLPPEWFDFLAPLRSRDYKLLGEEFTYHKFVSMGNGFCFPLETLLFASLCAATYDELSLPHDFVVYGDDIIIRQSAAVNLLKYLKICGFKANPKKTFLQGPFRESCGADWYEGKDVRPITLDYALDSVESIFKFCNLVRQKEVTATFFYEHLKFLEELIPPECRFVRPFRGDVATALEVSFENFISSPFASYDQQAMCWSWVELVKSGLPDKPVYRMQGYDVALIKAALTGSPSSLPFAERRNTRTKIRRVFNGGGQNTSLPEEIFNPKNVEKRILGAILLGSRRLVSLVS